MKWKNGQEFVRPVYTPLSGANVRLLEQADRISSTTPEPGINGGAKVPLKHSVRMLLSQSILHINISCLSVYSMRPL
jgi:hypothetical protein